MIKIIFSLMFILVNQCAFSQTHGVYRSKKNNLEIIIDDHFSIVGYNLGKKDTTVFSYEKCTNNLILSYNYYTYSLQETGDCDRRYIELRSDDDFFFEKHVLINGVSRKCTGNRLFIDQAKVNVLLEFENYDIKFAESIMLVEGKCYLMSFIFYPTVTDIQRFISKKVKIRRNGIMKLDGVKYKLYSKSRE